MKKILVVALCALSMTIFTAFTSTTPEVNTTISTNVSEMYGGIISWSISGGPAYVYFNGHMWGGGYSGGIWVPDAIDPYSVTVTAGEGYRIVYVSYDQIGYDLHFTVMVRPVDE